MAQDKSDRDEWGMVEELNISIKVLCVGKKPMTQSVFKQLPYGEMIDEKVPALIHRPLGWVNHWFHKDDTAVHLFRF